MGGRNQNGNFIGQPIGNDKLKVEMKFSYAVFGGDEKLSPNF